MTFAEWEAQRKGGQAPGVAPTPSSEDDSPLSSILPRTGAMIGGLAGMAGPLAGALGAAAGSGFEEAGKALPGLWENGLRGPYSSEGVGDQMLKSLLNVGSDVAKSAVLDRIPGWIGKGLSKGGEVATKIGASEMAQAPAWKRALAGTVLDPLAHSLGMPTGVTAGTAVAGPPIARTAGPLLSRAGEALPERGALEGLKNVLSRRGSEVKAGWGAADEAADTGPFGRGADPSMRTTVDAARNIAGKGASRQQANQRAGYSVKSNEVPLDRTDVIDQPNMAEFRTPSEIAAQLADLSLTRKSLGANPVDARSQMFDRGVSQVSKGKLGRSVTPDIQDALNEMARKRYVSK